jgi:protein-S-isoprenylcysteine O-methyltransferase Ste14
MFYLISAILVAVLVLIISFAQVGATCTWYLISSTTPAFLVLLQVAGLGAVMGGLLVLFWKAPNPKTESEDEGVDTAV